MLWCDLYSFHGTWLHRMQGTLSGNRFAKLAQCKALDVAGSCATGIAACFVVLHCNLSKGESNLFRAVFWQETNEVTN